MQNARLLLKDLDPHLSVRLFRVDERINDLFNVTLTAVAPDESLALDELVGRPATFELAGSQLRRWRGLVAQAQLVRTAEHASGLATYAITLVPTLWRLSQRRDQRAFQHLSVPDIVRQILEQRGILQRWSIEQALYPKLELRTQFAEDDLSFVKRLLEEAGIAFYIDDEGGDDATVVFDDAPHSRALRAAALPFVDAIEQAQAGGQQYATSLAVEQRSLPGAFTLVDYDPRRPRMPLFAADKSDRELDAEHEQYIYAPGRFVAEHADRSAALDPRSPTISASRVPF